MAATHTYKNVCICICHNIYKSNCYNFVFIISTFYWWKDTLHSRVWSPPNRIQTERNKTNPIRMKTRNESGKMRIGKEKGKELERKKSVDVNRSKHSIRYTYSHARTTNKGSPEKKALNTHIYYIYIENRCWHSIRTANMREPPRQRAKKNRQNWQQR